MKEVEINTTIKDFAGKDITGQDQKPLRIKDIMLQYMAGYTGKDANKVMLARRVGQKIYNQELGPCKLEDAEFELLNEAITANPQHAALVFAPVLEALKKAKPIT